MKNFIKSEKLIYILIAIVFIGAFFAVYTKTEQKLESIRKATPVIIHDVTTQKADKDKTVYITPSGKKYHLDGCDYLNENCFAISLTDAVNAKYEACAYCNP